MMHGIFTEPLKIILDLLGVKPLITTRRQPAITEAPPRPASTPVEPRAAIIIPFRN